MIDRLPGWLNFIILWLFYFIVTSGVLLLWRLLLGRYPEPFEQAMIISMFYAGGYLAKWREKQGGGWSFW